MNFHSELELSVVTVVLNDFSGLTRTIKSVKEQTDLRIQHVIVDGGSSDGSAELAKTSSHVSVESRPDGGIYKAMQRGFDAASGKYLIFTNAGDSLFGKHFLAKAIGELKDSNSQWGFGPLVEESQRGTAVWTPVDGAITVSRLAHRKTYVPFPTVVCSRELIAKVNGFSFMYEIAGDFDLILRLAKEELPIRWDYPIARFAAGGISYTQAPKAWSEERIIRKENLSC
jgi:GT2 family glycosyltransferase